MKTLKKTSILTLMLITGLIFSTTAFAQDAKVVEMEGTNQMKFTVTEIKAEPVQKITVKLTTVSNLPPMAMSHNFVLLKDGVDVSEFAIAASRAKDNDYIPEDKKDEIIAYTDLAGGGETVTVTFTAPEKSGEYEYICTFPGHYQGGMVGTLVVK